jgi:ABC-type transporter MlaC component
MSTMRGLALAGLLAAFAAAPGAVPGTAWAASDPIDPAAAKSYVGELGEKALSLLNGNAAQADKVREFTVLMIKSVDFHDLGRQVLGTTYRKGSDAEREEFTRYFAAYFIDTVIGMLNDLQFTGFEIGDTKTYPNEEVAVTTQIAKSDGETLETGWRLASNAGALKIIDVIVKGASAADHFRNQIAHGTQSSNIKGNVQKLQAQLKDSQTLSVVEANL